MFPVGFYVSQASRDRFFSANHSATSVKMATSLRWLCVLLLGSCVICVFSLENEDKPKKKKKDIRDYNDADMARLLEQWEVRVAFC